MDISNRTKQLTLISIFLAWMILISTPWANAHFGGFLVQLQDGRIVVGQDSETPGGQPSWNTQAVGSLFAPGQYSDLPSFLSLATAPTGTQALPPTTNIYWDFLPMTTGGYTSNLLYWDGVGTNVSDVEFGPVPVPPLATDVTMGMYNTEDGAQAIVSDTPDMIAGSLLGVTNAVGSGLRLHRHNYFLLDDGDQEITTFVAEGVYLVALQLRMPGYGTSKPIFVVPGTFELVDESLESLTAAVAWAEENAALLIREGDYDFDGDVDSTDQTTWTQQYGSTGPWPINGDFADGNRDSIVNASDYVIWRKFASGLGASPASFSAAVPEPSSMLILGGLAAFLALRRQNR